MSRSTLSKHVHRAGRNRLAHSRLRCLTVEPLEDRRMLAYSTMDLTTGLTAEDLAQLLVGEGVSISNVRFTGSPLAAGIFTGGLSDDLGIETGVILSSGNIFDSAGPNLSESTTTSFDLPGDPDLDGLIPGFETFDAAVLEFDFVASGGTISVSYVFGSEEYNEFVGSPFNDVFGFFLDGQNIALIPGTTTAVSINNVNSGMHPELFNNNSPADLGIPTPFHTEADGFTVVLQATATVTPGTHQIKLAIADAGDTILDSWVWLQASSFVSGEVDLEITKIATPDPVVINNPLTYTLFVTNHGPDPASGVRVEDILPPGVTFVGATASQGTTIEADGVVTASLGSLAVGASATVTIEVIPHEFGLITNTATVTSFQIETAPENNIAVQVTSVEPARLSIDDVTIVEGNAGTRPAVFTVSLNSTDIHNTITVHYATADVTAMAGSDYIPVSGILTFAPGVRTRFITVPIIGDRFNEPTETFLVQLFNPVNAELVKSVGVGTIIDNDPLPTFYVSDVFITTENAGPFTAEFTVALDIPSGRTVTVAYATSNGTAQAGSDYLPQSGTLTFAPGVRTQKISVPVMTSDIFGPNKTFFLNLANPLNALLAVPRGTGTIVYAAEPLGEFIVDNGDAAYTTTGTWATLTNTLAYGLDYAYAAPGNGNASATWHFVGIPNGPYEVFARWSHFSNRATNAPYTMLDNGVPVGTVLVNQQLPPAGEHSNGIFWQSLGMFETTTNNFAVRLGNNANGYVVADAIRIVAGGIAPQVPEIDVAGFQHSIITGNMTPAPENATDFGQVPLLTDSQIHTFTIVNNGNAPLYLTGAPRVAIGGPHAADFLVMKQPASVVQPGKKTTFDLMFHPSAAGPRTATVSIANNDDNENPYTFAIQGNSNQAASPLHNAGFPQDVNGDGRITPADVLVVINTILTAQAGVMPLTAGESAVLNYPDVNGDGRITPADALMVINYLLAPPAAGPLAAESQGVAEPLAAPAIDKAFVLLDLSEEPLADAAARIEFDSTSESDSGQASATAATLLVPERIGALYGSEGDDDGDSSEFSLDLELLALEA